MRPITAVIIFWSTFFAGLFARESSNISLALAMVAILMIWIGVDWSELDTPTVNNEV